MDRAAPPSRSPTPARAFGPEGLGETKAKILEAAFRRLTKEGYTALSTREIARDAGVNHALISYHFGGKDALVIAVLDEANRQLLQRQQAMYREPGDFAAKWAQARRFYRDDLASGFVRVQAELWGASLADPRLREKFVPRIRAWKKVVSDGVGEAIATLEACGVELAPPFSASVIACWISEFWLGMEFSELLGERSHHQAALDAVEKLLEDLDARVRKHARGTRGGKPRGARRPA